MIKYKGFKRDQTKFKNLPVPLSRLGEDGIPVTYLKDGFLP
jgi:hypothetical protein